MHFAVFIRQWGSPRRKKKTVSVDVAEIPYEMIEKRQQKRRADEGSARNRELIEWFYRKT